MGRVRSSNSERAGHRAGPLKQTNKKHKTGRHRSKGVLDAQTRGRVTSLSVSSTASKKGKTKRSERKRQAQVDRLRKIQSTLKEKEALGGLRGAPITVALIPLSATTNTGFMLKYVLSNLSSGIGEVVGQSQNGTHVKLSSGKKLLLVEPPDNSIWSILDTLKQADVSLFLLPVLEPLTPEGFAVLKSAKEQGVPTPFMAVSSSFSKTEEKAWMKSCAKFLALERIFPLINPGQVGNLLRLISVAKMKIHNQYTLRSSMFLEESWTHHAIEESAVHPNLLKAEGPQCLRNLLEVRGIVRRKALNPWKPVLISGVGCFRILRVDITPVQNPEEIKVAVPPRFVYDPESVPDSEKGAAHEEIHDEEMGGSDIDALSDEEDEKSESGSQMSEDIGQKKKKNRLPKGTSEYQADWLEDAGEELVGSDEELENEDEEENEGSEEEEEEDEMDWEEEKRQLQIAKDAKTEAEFPDWVDTPLEIPAKVRFQKYRGLQSFKNSPWDVNENLPKEYAKIVQFQNYKHVYKQVVKNCENDGVGFIPVGQRVTLLLQPLDETTSSQVGTIGSSKPVSLVSLLRHEMKMSVINLQLNFDMVVKNKEPLIFQVGHYRFTATPILSQVSPGNKHKMVRYSQVNETLMVTVFAPIFFPPCNVLAFKTSKEELVPVASGHLFSIDPNRLVIKRVLLSGHPFKVMKSKSVIRFMFFTREDIEWFKPVELRTRYGRRGHIKEPLGTHGHMKCSFDGQMKSQDTVLMPLYKRVFPKWTYSPIVQNFTVYDSYKN